MMKGELVGRDSQILDFYNCYTFDSSGVELRVVIVQTSLSLI